MNHQRGLSSLSIFIISAIALIEMATDMYLPNLPAVLEEFASSEALLQMTLSANLLGLATAGLLAGPLSESFGRRRLIFAGLLIFLLGGILCMIAPSVMILLGARLIQGLGGGVVLVVGMASIRDLYHSERLAKIMSLMGMVIALSPGIAPIIGGYIGVYLGWRSTFGLLVICGFILLLVAIRMLPETLLIEKREHWVAKNILKQYIQVFKVRSFVLNGLLLAFTIGQLWIEMGNLPFLFIQTLDVASQHYGIYFGSQVFVFILGTIINQRYVTRFGVNRMLLTGVVLKVFSILLVCGMAWFSIKDPWVIQMSFYPGAIGLALVIGNASSRSLSSVDKSVGFASAIMTLLQMLFAATVLFICGLFFNGTLWPIGIAGLIWIGLVAAVIFLDKSSLEKL